jgi:hypothetical protein
MANLADFIHIYENNLDHSTCDYLINLFEGTSANNVYNLTDNKDISEEVSTIHQKLLKIVINTRNDYYNYCFGKVFPDNHAFEKFTITKISTEDPISFDATVDVKSYEDSRRFLCFMWYLNHNNGGHTKFLDLTIQPEIGKLVVYPPFWMFPHKEEAPVSDSKYILTTYLHYK